MALSGKMLKVKVPENLSQLDIYYNMDN